MPTGRHHNHRLLLLTHRTHVDVPMSALVSLQALALAGRLRLRLRLRLRRLLPGLPGGLELHGHPFAALGPARDAEAGEAQAAHLPVELRPRPLD